MKQAFSEKLKLSKANIERLDTINSILEDYREEWYVLTLRQLYYQLVVRDIIPNQQAEYAKLSNILKKGRMAGIVDRDIIEDRLRQPFLPYWVLDIDDAINDTINTYRLNRMDGQDKYIEIRVEKDALSWVLKRVSSKYHINLMVNRGYSSCSAMYDSFRRFSQHEDCHILYLGDHDPSGLDMVRDIQERLEEFWVYLTVHHLAITQEQIATHNPPPNPAKFSDPRADWYVKNYGKTSWEVDALPPEVLINTLEAKIRSMIDLKRYSEMLEKEASDKERLQEMIDNWVFDQ